MKNKIINFIILLICAGMIVSCYLFDVQKPTQKDGAGKIFLTVYIDTVAESSAPKPAINLPVEIKTNDYSFPTIYAITDSNGQVLIENLPYASYTIQSILSFTKPGSNEKVQIGGAAIVDLISETPSDSIFTTSFVMGSQRGFKINEVYSSGPASSLRYWNDLFLELYNGSGDTVYVDGMVVLRLGTSLLFSDVLKVTYIYQFPGTPLTGREYPVAPAEFVVLAGQAFNHNLIGPLRGKTVDLSHADWEFLNEIEPGALDNSNVPNITTNNGQVVQSSKVGFLIGMSGDGLALCDGTDYDQTDGIDISTVIDCIELSASPTHTKEVPYSVDMSFGGLGLVKYKGQSVERILPGFDTNNSRIDFEVINKPTPGYHHE